MKVALVRIGNSHGIRIPKPIIEQCGFGEQVSLEVDGDRLIVSPSKAPRAGWDEAFARMATAGEDAPLLQDDLAQENDDAEWQW